MPFRAWPILLVIFIGLGLLVYRDALLGPFVSDDIGYIVNSPYTAQLTLESVARILDPWGDARLFTANYAPVHLLLTSLERQIFADGVLGYHLVNIVVHAMSAVLLVALFIQSGLAPAASVAGGLLFALHPANVEAVAWISQLKTNAALVFSLASLLALPRRPAIASLLFAIGLLTKASAAFALPMAAAFLWSRPPASGSRRAWVWILVWGILLALYAAPQLASFSMRGEVQVEAFEDPAVHLRTIAAVGARYLVMAATSYGVAAFAEPPPAISWLDRWWLLALPAGGLLLWRTVVSLRRRSEEGAYWVGAIASFAPVSQVFPFLIPVADRYLYFILPGLIGGTLFAALEVRDRLAARGIPSARIAGVAGAAVLVLAAVFGMRSAQRAHLWTNETLLNLDAARAYPEGGTAAFLEARRAAREGDADRAVLLLRRAADKGIDRFAVMREDPGLAPIRNDPAFRELIHEMAGRLIETARRENHHTQPELRAVAYAHFERGELALAEVELERALAAGGPLDETVRMELARVRAARAAEEKSDRPERP